MKIIFRKVTIDDGIDDFEAFAVEDPCMHIDIVRSNELKRYLCRIGTSSIGLSATGKSLILLDSVGHPMIYFVSHCPVCGEWINFQKRTVKPAPTIEKKNKNKKMVKKKKDE